MLHSETGFGKTKHYPSSAVAIERLEDRRLASVSYVSVGRKIRPVITDRVVASFTTTSLPAGEYQITVVAGSMTYEDTTKPRVYHVNDFNTGDFGFKIFQTGSSSFIRAPGRSTPRTNSARAAADSKGLSLKFRHSRSGKIGIFLQDEPYKDNAPGIKGSPEFVLKQRVVTPTKPAVVNSFAAVPATASFSSAPVMHSMGDTETGSRDLLDLLT